MRTSKTNTVACSKKARKIARIKGQSYNYKSVNSYGIKSIKKRECKVVGLECTSKKCEQSEEKKCNTFSEEDRNSILSQFWQLDSWDAKKVFIANHVKIDVGFGTVRKSNEYYLTNQHNEKVLVCRDFFLNTLAIKETPLKKWLKEIKFGLLVKKEKNKHNKKKEKNDTFFLHSFTETVEKLPSHYSRAKSNKLYVNHKFNSLRELYDKYTEYCLNKIVTPCGRSTFERFFYKSNLSLFVPKKDQCNKCVAFNNGVLNETDFNNHIKKKEDAKLEKEKDKLKALNGEIVMITNDAQATKSCPNTEANIMYFHLKLCVHNNTIFDVSSKVCKNYMYTELDATACASTFITCIHNFICTKCITNRNIKKIVIWCDNCTYQNKNVILSNALLQLCVRYQIEITLKYLEVGHTFLECDSVHSLLERNMKHVNIYEPIDYVKLAVKARKNPFPYEAELMSYNFFLDFTVKDGQFYTSLRPPKENNSNYQLKVNDLVAVKHNSQGEIHYKITHTEVWKKLKTKPKTNPCIVNYPKLYTSPLKIDYVKFDHLQAIKKTLPAYVHNYYDNLPHEKKKIKNKD